MEGSQALVTLVFIWIRCVCSTGWQGCRDAFLCSCTPCQYQRTKTVLICLRVLLFHEHVVCLHESHMVLKVSITVCWKMTLKSENLLLEKLWKAFLSNSLAVSCLCHLCACCNGVRTHTYRRERWSTDDEHHGNTKYSIKGRLQDRRHPTPTARKF